MELHARFDIAPGQNWATVRLEAADWHLGSLQGTQATPAQLKALMAGSHLLAVGGRCAGWVEGQTSYPCGFAIEVLKLDSELLMAGPLHAYGWESTLAKLEQRVWVEILMKPVNLHALRELGRWGKRRPSLVRNCFPCCIQVMKAYLDKSSNLKSATYGSNFRSDIRVTTQDSSSAVSAYRMPIGESFFGTMT